VAYLAGTRLAVYWIAGLVPAKTAVAAFARDYDLTADRVRAAVAYAQAFSEEIQSDREHAEANRQWIEAMDMAAHAPQTAKGQRKGKHRPTALQ